MSKREETRQFIIEKAAPIFNIKGIAATAMSDVMEATGLSKGSMYVHFRDKDDLACAVVDYNIALLNSKVQAAVSKAGTPRAQLTAFINTLINPLNPPVTGGCPLLNFGTEADDTNEAVKSKVHTAIKQAQQTIAGIIKKGIDAGVFKPGWNYTEFATVMFAMIEGGQLISRVAGNNSKIKLIAQALEKMIDEQTI